MTTTKEITEVAFGTPPEASKGILGRVPGLLMGKPGRWAKVRTGMTQKSAQRLASKIRKGHIKLFPIGQFEACARTADAHSTAPWDVWMRYVGAEDGNG